MNQRKEKKQDEPNEFAGKLRWLVSYADFLTLLFAFFVIMYAHNAMTPSKNKAVRKSIVKAMSLQPVPGNPAPSAGHRTPFKHLDSPIPLSSQMRKRPPELPKRVRQAIKKQTKELKALQAHLNKALAPLVKAGKVKLISSPQGVVIRFNARVLFPNASASLTSSAVPIVDKVAHQVSQFPYPVYVKGYTNRLPIHTKQFKDNWSLSVQRATTVTRHLITDGIPAKSITAEGYSHFHPLVKPHHKGSLIKNRRVSVVVKPKEDQVLKAIYTTYIENKALKKAQKSAISKGGTGGSHHHSRPGRAAQASPNRSVTTYSARPGSRPLPGTHAASRSQGASSSKTSRTSASQKSGGKH